MMMDSALSENAVSIFYIMAMNVLERSTEPRGTAQTSAATFDVLPVIVYGIRPVGQIRVKPAERSVCGRCDGKATLEDV